MAAVTHPSQPPQPRLGAPMSASRGPRHPPNKHPERRTPRTSARRRHALSTLAHRLVLLLTLTIGAGALVYNAVSIVNGEPGLMGLPALSGAGWPSGLPSFRG